MAIERGVFSTARLDLPTARGFWLSRVRLAPSLAWNLHNGCCETDRAHGDHAAIGLAGEPIRNG